MDEIMRLDAGWQLDFEIARLLGYEKRRLRHFWAFYKNDKACFKSFADQDETYRFNKCLGIGDPPSLTEWSTSADNARKLPIPSNMCWEFHIVDKTCSAFLCDRDSDFVFFSNINESENLALAIIRTWLQYVSIFILQGKEG
jgi:hypothetical protein